MAAYRSILLSLTPEQRERVLRPVDDEVAGVMPLTDEMIRLIEGAEERYAGYIARWLERCPELRDFFRAKPR